MAATVSATMSVPSRFGVSTLRHSPVFTPEPTISGFIPNAPSASHTVWVSAGTTDSMTARSIVDRSAPCIRKTPEISTAYSSALFLWSEASFARKTRRSPLSKTPRHMLVLPISTASVM